MNKTLLKPDLQGMKTNYLCYVSNFHIQEFIEPPLDPSGYEKSETYKLVYHILENLYENTGIKISPREFENIVKEYNIQINDDIEAIGAILCNFLHESNIRMYCLDTKKNKDIFGYLISKGVSLIYDRTNADIFEGPNKVYFIYHKQ